ncbi:NUDIX hydrolase [Clostridium sp. 19966]|uniref:NUDIX hydrolase n=1 Tax=Clostridium sp. 19966 TaxID=2768166 RepID=UPI0028E016F8|nr:NUDIX hydrolase [Clostridium sp. 19966]MDT8717698.1 NUDIX hydrolase [Clostridium sp. 19966]
MVMPTHIVAAAGIVKNVNDEILLVKTYYGGWVFPGGQVEIGENIPDAVIREIMEESGLEVTVEKLFAISSNTASHKGYNGVETVPTKVMLDFICNYVGGNLCTSEETSDSRWVKKEKVLNMITTPAIRQRFQAYLDYDGSVQYLEYVTQPEFILKLKRKI